MRKRVKVVHKVYSTRFEIIKPIKKICRENRFSNRFKGLGGINFQRHSFE